MTRQTNVAGAAVLAGLIAGGAVYAAGHRVGDPALTASADARSTLMRVHPTVARHPHLLQWHPLDPPKPHRLHVAAVAPTAAAGTVAAAAPVAAASVPTTHTSPAASGDDEHESEAGDD